MPNGGVGYLNNTHKPFAGRAHAVGTTRARKDVVGTSVCGGSAYYVGFLVHCGLDSYLYQMEIKYNKNLENCQIVLWKGASFKCGLGFRQMLYRDSQLPRGKPPVLQTSENFFALSRTVLWYVW